MHSTARMLVQIGALCLVMGASGQAWADEVALPQRIVDAKVLKVGIQNQYPPLNFVDPKTKALTGFNVDLFNALGARLNIPINLVVDTFPSLLPALDTGRSDLMGTGIFDSAKRREKYTFVDYMKSGPVLVTTVANGQTIQATADVCGRSVGIPRTVASFADVMKAFSDENCIAKGKPAVKVITDDLPPQLGLVQNRYETALMAEEAVLYLQQTQPNSLKTIGEPLHTWLFGIAFKLDDTALRDAVAKGIDGLIADGTYSKLLEKYNLTSMAIDQTAIDEGQY